MYQYDQIDREIIDARLAEFSDQVARRISGELDEDHFKPLRLRNGLYLQLHAYMLRVAVPYGTLSSRKMRALAHVARTWDRGYGHFTTRQNMQFHWIALQDVPEIQRFLADNELHSIQTSGNCIRNISADQYAGAAAEEVDDPRPWAELLRQWSSFHPEFTHLPRKFKIAVSGSEFDRAAIRLYDIGLQLVRRDGVLGVRVYVGGGLGRTPIVAPLVRDFVPMTEFVSYLEAALRVYNRYGRRDNIWKARIKILVSHLGAEEYARQVDEEHAHVKAQGGFDPPAAEIERIKKFFVDPPFENGLPEDIDRSDPDFALWVDQQVAAHKRAGYSIVNISLKPVGETPGDISADQMDAVADLSDRYAYSEIRLTHSQSLVLPHVRTRDLKAVWEGLREIGLAEANLGLATDIIACPGLDYCTLANARSIPVAQEIARRLAPRQADLGELKIKISGCINACGHHHAGHIGILGVDRKGVENYQLSIGGCESVDTSLAEILGPGFSEEGVVDAVEKVTQYYLETREPGERLLDTWRRLGPKPFKEAVYG